MQTNATNTRRWLDPNGDKIVQGDPFNPAENGELGPSTNLNFGKPITSVAATFQTIPGPQIAANAVYASAQIAPSLGRPLSSAASATINIVKAATLYGERMHQLDLRLTKILKLGGRFGALASVDFFNALNSSHVIGLNNTYGATIGATAGSAWQSPFAILSGRLTKVRLQLTF
jgi:hypothetical protein